ncbi:hypothetical protein ACSBR1_038855 [Camellia fascicularis]
MSHIFGLVTILLLICGSAMAGPPCGTVIDHLIPCLPYLTNFMNSPSKGCCNGARAVANMSQSRNDLTEICDCIVSTINNIVGIDTSLIPPLPGICGLQITLPPLSNCSICHEIPVISWRNLQCRSR